MRALLKISPSCLENVALSGICEFVTASPRAKKRCGETLRCKSDTLTVASVIEGTLRVERLLIINMHTVWEKQLRFSGDWHASPILLV